MFDLLVKISAIILMIIGYQILWWFYTRIKEIREQNQQILSKLEYLKIDTRSLCSDDSVQKQLAELTKLLKSGSLK